MKFWLATLLVICPGCWVAADEAPPCLNNLEINFFEIRLLGQALSLHDVPQGQWDPIFRSLVSRSQTVPYRVSEKAEALTPNPLDFPFNGKEVKLLLRRALYEVFKEALEENDVTDEEAINSMFDYIYQRNVSVINDCMKEQD